MNRIAPAALVALFLVPVVAADEFGGGEVTFQEYVGPDDLSAPEPTIGIPWNTDHIFYLAGSQTFRIVVDDAGTATWTDVTPLTTSPVNLDPMLIADEVTGRIMTGGLVGPCSVMNYSDDDGETWVPAGNMCSGANFDHQSIGLGPKPIIGTPADMPQLLNGYYCGQLVTAGCAVSLDGGVTWTIPTPAAYTFLTDGCGGFHGHWRISPVTGTAFLPMGACGGQRGMVIPNILGVDGTEPLGLTGITFGSRLVEGSHEWTGGFDPSIGLSRDSGWLYYGDADHMGARMALSKDEGVTWEQLGAGEGVATTTWLDVGQFHDPPVVKATFADVQAGDDDRVAFTFLGLEDLDGDGRGDEYEDLYTCDAPEAGENRFWNYYAAFSYDAGQSWDVHKLTDHPVQVGGIWDGGGGNPCRNLLDFNDMDIDSTGRVHIGWADGCLGSCWELEDDDPGRYLRQARLLRQTGGMGLFAAHDQAVLDDPDSAPDTESDDDSQDSPIGAVVLAAALAVALTIRRRR